VRSPRCESLEKPAIICVLLAWDGGRSFKQVLDVDREPVRSHWLRATRTSDTRSVSTAPSIGPLIEARP
jgi:hypothetical protein